MTIGPRTVLAIGGGYLLGRTKTLKFAIAIGGAVTGRALPSSSSELLRMGVKFAATSPELSRLRDAIGGRLLMASRDAAIAGATSQLEALTDRLSARIDVLTQASGTNTSNTNGLDPASALSNGGQAQPIGPGTVSGERLVIEPTDVLTTTTVENPEYAGNGHVQGAHS